jgi:acyl-CoA thioesterase
MVFVRYEEPERLQGHRIKQGKIYSKEGKLVASVILEGLIRNHAMKKNSRINFRHNRYDQ